jgi:hypothetical protein
MTVGINYALFRCKECSLTMNADRKASLALAAAAAAKTLLDGWSGWTPESHSRFPAGESP